MNEYKCSFCNSTIIIKNNEKIVICDNCGSVMPLPKLELYKMFNKATQLRLEMKFQAAYGVYDGIVKTSPDEPEAYWGRVLCDYGMVYFENEDNKSRTATCFIANRESVFENENYKNTIEYANEDEKKIYFDEANVIDEIQKGIFEIADKEKPYEIMICSSESETEKKIVSKLNLLLTNEGYRVFTFDSVLKGKSQTAYEPYIYSALHSASVLITVADTADSFLTSTSKNIWKRFFDEYNGSAEKEIISVLSGIDTNDVPFELHKLAVVDYDKEDAENVLLELIKNSVIDSQHKEFIESEQQDEHREYNISRLLKRVTVFLDDGEWDIAEEYCTHVLDIEPDNSIARVGRIMAQKKLHKEEELSSCDAPLTDIPDYRFAIRFADDEYKKRLQKYNIAILDRIENKRCEDIYSDAEEKFKSCKTESDYSDVEEIYRSIKSYKDAQEKAEKCCSLAEEKKEEAIRIANDERREKYEAAIKLKDEAKTQAEYLKVAEYFSDVKGYQDAEKFMNEALESAKERQAVEEQERIEKERIQKIKIKKRKIIIIISSVAVALIIAFLVALKVYIIPSGNYSSALDLMNKENYSQAAQAFAALNNFNDSKDKYDECVYKNAVVLFDKGSYNEAKKEFTKIKEYKDSSDKITDCSYRNAGLLFADNKYSDALKAFTALGNYKDSKEYASKARLNLISSANVGDTVELGEYEQDNNSANGKEVISWTVLNKKSDSVLLISKKAIDFATYNTQPVYITWQESTLRKWLNKGFINSVFSQTESKAILSTKLSNFDNEKYNTSSGYNTNDKVFLLSGNQAETLLTADTAKCCATAYATKNGVQSVDGYCSWWLRTSGKSNTFSSIITASGKTDYSGEQVDSKTVGLRPAMWVSIK